MTILSDIINTLFERVRAFWEGRYSRTATAAMILLVYLLSLAAIELGRRGLLPQVLGPLAPRSHYAAINFAFTVLLYLELIDLVFGLAKSVSRSVGKQFEIFSLILLRQSFKDFSDMPEPLHWPTSSDAVLHILSSAGGALLIFGILTLYYRMLYHPPITIDEKENLTFITTKKAISLLLLAIFAWLGIYSLRTLFENGSAHSFFATFYTIMVFCDVLIVLVSIRFSHAYPVVFRNSGFALATVVLRLSLAAPAYYNAALGVGAALYLLGLNAVYNLFVCATHKPAECLQKPEDSRSGVAKGLQ
jgi:hypothetical protein